MQLCYKYLFDGEEISEMEVQEGTAADLADTARASKTGSYQALRRMAQAYVQSLNGNDDREFVKSAVCEMPMFSLYQAVLLGTAATKGLSSVEGRYRCPSCGTVRFYGKTEDDDLSDPMDSLFRGQCPTLELPFSLKAPVRIVDKRTGEDLVSVEGFTMRHPAISSYIRGESRHPDDPTRAMFWAYGDSLLSVNGKPVDSVWKQKFADLVFSKMPISSINAVTEKLSEWSMGWKMERTCLQCKNRWKADVDTSGFFS